MNRYALLVVALAASLHASGCNAPKETGGGFGAPVGIRMEATGSTPAFEMAIAANSKEFPAALVSPISAAVVTALKGCPPPASAIIGLNLSLDDGALSELAGAPQDEQSRCVVAALKAQKLDAKAAGPESAHLQLMAQLRFSKPSGSPRAP